MLWVRLLASAMYLTLVIVLWLNAGAALGLLFLGMAIFLIFCFRVAEAGEAITDFARFHVSEATLTIEHDGGTRTIQRTTNQPRPQPQSTPTPARQAHTSNDDGMISR